MPRNPIIYLMYHELEVPGRRMCQSERGYVRYVVREAAFREQVNWLRSNDMLGRSVSCALDQKVERGVVITFDDGCETDLRVAAPILREAGFGATFYVTVGFLGQPGYMVERQVRELSDAGFEIGCHSMTHPYLDELDESQMKHEIVDAKLRLEEITGRSVVHFSCPGGRWTPQVVEIARGAGYRSVTTSRVAANHAESDSFSLARVAIMRETPLSAFQQICRGRGLWQKQLRTVLQATSHQILGNALYDRLRGLLLERGTRES
jgi:peptidoglycan/xylan/chitin deacetylase (PgdA/CDA1 family)